MAILVPLAALFLWVALRAGPLAPISVTVAQVEDRAIAPALFGIGTVEARYTHKIGPTAPGRLTSVVVDVGDRVRPGQLVALLDPIDLDQRIRAASDNASRSAALERSAAAQIADAEARLELAASEARRAEALLREGWTTRAAVDQRRQALAAAKAALVGAGANRSAAAMDRERALSDRAALVEQKANLRLTSPRSGLVIRRLAEPGTTIVAGQAVIEVIDSTELWINGRFDQTRAFGIAAGLPARIVLRSSPERPLRGSVLRVEPVADAVTEEILAKIGFDPGADLPPIGELAEVAVALPARARTLAVPNAAIHRIDGEVGVWVIRDGDLEFAPVRLGAEDAEGRVQVLDGLVRGERIVLHSARPLTSNSRISVVDNLP